MEAYVTCQVCQKNFKIITSSHLKKCHNMTMEEYKNMFPDTPLGISRKYYKKENNETNPPINNETLIENKTDIPIYENYQEINKSDFSFEDEILYNLKKILPNIKKNITILKQHSDLLIYKSTVDFADEVNKIIINFPKAIFHNVSKNVFERRLDLIEKDGWRILNIFDFNDYIKTVKNFLKGY